tara:strand:- start:4071 stop:4829 length:759 start_codon:yes stop_codon:yes gene_type:complete
MALDAKNIIGWIKEYAALSYKDALVVGVSGGVDSSLVSTLCAETGLKTIVIRMPIHQLENQDDLSDSHASWLLEKYPENVVYKTKEMSDLFDEFSSLLVKEETSKLSLANTRSRLRMIMLYQIASMSNGLVVGTGNKVEDFGVGFFTKYGDGGVDISPIADLYKTEVRQMAASLGILESIVAAVSTDGLWDDGRTDEDQIGATYEELEWAMKYVEGDFLDGRKREVLEIYRSFHNANEHKMVSIPVCTDVED